MSQPFVLNIDSNAVTRNAIASILEPEELSLRDASTLGQAVQLAAELNPAVVIVAPQLEDARGGDVCREIGRHCAAAKILRVDPGQVPGGHADLFLPDPPVPQLLIAAVHTLLRLKEAEQSKQTAAAALVSARSEINMMISRMGHDFSEAVRAVSTLLELIRQGGQHRLSSTETGYMVHVDAALNRSKHLLQSLTTYAQIGREAASLRREFELEGAFWAAQAQMRPLLDETGGSVEKEGQLPRVFGNPARLQQLFVSLLTNAVRYRRPDAPLQIRVFAQPEPDGQWRISISDNGPGIAAEDREAIFTPFHRLHGREIPGAGMGLAIGRRIVEATGGRIWAESTPDRGATFCFTLPAASP